jgi:mRNA interferase RelE/StbE
VTAGKYRILVERQAAKHLPQIDPTVRRRIAAAIDALATEPEPPGCKALKGRSDVLRIRVGDYRILYIVDRDAALIEILDIGHRRDIYRR